MEKNSKERMQGNGQENRRRQGELYILAGKGEKAGGEREVVGKFLRCPLWANC